jgi:hypothetical protein
MCKDKNIVKSATNFLSATIVLCNSKQPPCPIISKYDRNENKTFSFEFWIEQGKGVFESVRGKNYWILRPNL